jgi:TolB-like protein/Flp pilus assembly protein TadD
LIESIAVLPFENNDPGTEYLSDGLTESVINNLARLPNLRVISRNSVFRYKGQQVDSTSAGKELNVRAVLTGRVIQRGDNLIVSAELTDLENNKQIWGQQYNRQATDAFTLQQTVSQDISETLRSALTGASQSAAKRETVDPEAYQLYLKGRFFWNKRTAADVRKSVSYFQQAIDKEPSYALAYAALADAYILIPSYSDNSQTEDSLKISPQEAYTKAKEAAAKALELDETLTEPHASLATVMYEYEENFTESEREFKKAIELNPNYATAHQWYAELLLRLGRNQEAIAEIKLAQELDPLSLIINSIVGVAYMENRQYDQAIEQLQKTIEMDANFSRAHMFLAQAFERKEMFEEAISEHEKRFILDKKSPQEAVRQAESLRKAYRQFAKDGYYRKQIEMYEKGEISWSLTRAASFYVQIGENDKAFALLEKANSERQLRNIKSPIFDGIRTEPRFQDLLRHVGLPQ